jgi:hypothetical protein
MGSLLVVFLGAPPLQSLPDLCSLELGVAGVKTPQHRAERQVKGQHCCSPHMQDPVAASGMMSDERTFHPSLRDTHTAPHVANTLAVDICLNGLAE